MSDFLRQYGPDRREPSAGAKPTCGGVKEAKELPYSPPVGPKGQMHRGVGLGGTNHGKAGTQGRR